MGEAGHDISIHSELPIFPGTHGPPIVHNQIEDAEDHDQKHSAHLRLESNGDHHASHEAENADNDSPNAPLAREDETQEQEDEQYSPSELHIHLAVLLVNLRQTCWRELLAHPRVGEHHKETANHGEIAKEEVQIEDQAIPESLCDHDTEEAEDGVFGVLASDDQGGASGHRDDIDNQEEMGYASWDYISVQHAAIVLARMMLLLTVPIIVQVKQLIAPLCYYPQCVLEESDNDQEASDGWEISVHVQCMPTTFRLRVDRVTSVITPRSTAPGQHTA